MLPVRQIVAHGIIMLSLDELFVVSATEHTVFVNRRLINTYSYHLTNILSTFNDLDVNKERWEVLLNLARVTFIKHYISPCISDKIKYRLPAKWQKFRVPLQRNP